MEWKYGNNSRGCTYTCTKVLSGTEKNKLAHGTGHKGKMVIGTERKMPAIQTTHILV